MDATVLRNIFSRLGAKAIGYPLGFVASVFLIRYLGVERLGQYNYVSTFASLFGLLGGIGIPVLVTREAARDKARAASFLGAAGRVQTVLAALTVALVAIAAFVFNRPGVALPIVIVGVGIGLNALGAPYHAMLTGFEKMHVTSVIEVALSALRIVLILAAIVLGVDVLGLVTLLLAQPALAFLVLRTASNRLCGRPDVAQGAAGVGGLLRATAPFALMVVLNTLYFRVDIVMLEKMQGDAAVGIYSAAYKLIDAFMLIGTNAVGPLYPRMAALSVEAPVAVVETMQTAYRYMTAAALAVATGVTVLAPLIVSLLFGDAFRASAGVLQVLIWAIAAMYLYLPLAHALNATGREWQWVAVLAINTVCNIVGNLWLIRVYSVMGAAIATVLCELVGLVLVASFVRRFASIHYAAPLGPAVGASCAMAIVLGALARRNIIAAAVLATVAYGLTLYALRFFTPAETDALRRGLRFVSYRRA